MVTQYFTPQNIQLASETPIQLDRVRYDNQSYKADPMQQYVRGFQVSNCPIDELNGIYLEKGFFSGVPKYQHVRKWTIMRCELPEIEELGISAEDTYALANNNDGRLQKFYNKAGKTSFVEIISLCL